MFFKVIWFSYKENIQININDITIIIKLYLVFLINKMNLTHNALPSWGLVTRKSTTYNLQSAIFNVQ